MNDAQTRSSGRVMAISKMGNRRQVVIPKQICDDIGIKAGDFVEVVRNEKNIIIKPKKLVDLEDTLTPKEEELVAEGVRDIAQGNVISLDQLKNELGL